MTLGHDSRGYPLTGNYKYAADLGVSSIAGLTMLARSSGLDISIGSTYRNEVGSWHMTMNAIDIFATNKDMVKLADYLLQYTPFLGELLHTPPNAVKGNDGRFRPVQAVDNGERLNSLSEPVAREHFNHVHLAATMSALDAASKTTPQLRKQWLSFVQSGKGNTQSQNSTIGNTQVSPTYGANSPTQSKGGCLVRAAVILTPITAAASLIIPHVVR